MKLNHTATTLRVALSAAPRGLRCIRRFGRAALTLSTDGRWELLGGRLNDRQEAREWVSLFCHEALVDTRERR